MTEKITYVSIEKAGQMLNKSPHSVRQLLSRGKLGRHEMGHKVFVTLDSLETYHAKKKGIPSWEENLNAVVGRSFVSLPTTARSLMVQEPYIVRLIKNKQLEGYVTIAGDIMIAKDSINSYLRIMDNDTSDI